MNNAFFESPILNSPYAKPARHWELDPSGQPTHQIIEDRRPSDYITPIPKPRKRGAAAQGALAFDEGLGISDETQQYDPKPIINQLRKYVEEWRNSEPSKWNVTPETARLLKHWRHHPFSGVKPFFCQIEAVETLIWLTEVAPTAGKKAQAVLEHIKNANKDSNPELYRIALKLATGAGKTTVMAMIIAWQTINAVRRPSSTKFTRGFLVVAPGITIRDRLRVLMTNDPDSYYKSRELVPNEMLEDLGRAEIVITNYHAFKLREKMELSKAGRALLQPENTLETEGEMIRRVMPSLMGLKHIMVMNDEAHHCYRAKPDDEIEALKGDEKKEVEEANEAARLWISGLESVRRKIGVQTVVDLSATPFFLKGSGYAEGVLFGWTMSDFALMDAIECGIVKLPRVPVADNIPNAETPIYRNLWENIRKDMPKKGRGSGATLDPLMLPTKLQTALEALYGHYQKTYVAWQEAGIKVPPCFIIVCQNTAISKLVYDFVSGFHRQITPETKAFEQGRLLLFRNFDEQGNPLARPKTLLIDSQQLESGDALDDDFRKMAGPEIERFRREIIERTNDRQKADNISDQELLREVMNTVGRPGRLGESIRCVVSVSMLTEGWDANTVTHILGIRAFGTQLLCEQVVGRALRRYNYDLNSDGLFNVEYADVLGVPFDFTAKPVITKPQPPRETVQVKAISPERDAVEIVFPRVMGYRAELNTDHMEASFDADSVLELTPELVGPSITHNSGIIGEGVELSLVHTGKLRQAVLEFHLTKQLIYSHFRDPGEEPKLHLFGQLKRITRQWLDSCLKCKGGTFPAQLMYLDIAERACQKITAGITRTQLKSASPIKVVLDPYNPTGSTRYVNFVTSKTSRWQTDPRKCHLNWVITDSDWEAELCRIAEAHPNVLAYVKNRSMQFEIPYTLGTENRHYTPDFILLIDQGSGLENPLHLIVEVKGFRGEDVPAKNETMKTKWVPGVNAWGELGTWAFAEFNDIYDMDAAFERFIAAYTKPIPSALKDSGRRA